MKRDITIKNCLTTSKEMAFTPATLDVFSGDIALCDAMYAIEGFGFDTEIEQGLAELSRQFIVEKKQVLFYRGANVVMIVNTP